ncbi:MAG: B12-binding domain-containing radical SAM protein [Azoarcus sp.]|nr:B12-binding domain-containing radical SAM protein [Azoarcus sp.]
MATLAGLTPRDIQRVCYDDRLERINFDEPADAIVLPVETFTARRAYEIASEYRKRGVPVICGGFHARLCTEEVAEYAEVVAVGEAEELWPKVLDDLRHGTLKKIYTPENVPDHGKAPLDISIPDRSMYADKPYVPIRLLESGRGCGQSNDYCCDFCAIQAFFGPVRRRRPGDAVLEELKRLPKDNLLFFVDDNFIANIPLAKELLRAMIPLKLRWITQVAIAAAYDEELLDLMYRAGCQLILLGAESLRQSIPGSMANGSGTLHATYGQALDNMRRHKIPLYGTFVFGYDEDTPETFEEVFEFIMQQGFYIASFNILAPFPGTPLYARLEEQKRLLYPAWWLERGYKFNQIPFKPAGMSAEEVAARSLSIRRRFYSVPNILRRLNKWNLSNFFTARSFLPINLLQRYEAIRRQDFPLGDENWTGQLIKAQ